MKNIASKQQNINEAANSKPIFFLAAGLSLVASVYLFFSGHRDEGLFVGIWVPSILSGANLLMKES